MQYIIRDQDRISHQIMTTFSAFLDELKTSAVGPSTIGTKNERRYFLIVTEGSRTEPLYFEYWQTRLPKHLLETIKVVGEIRKTSWRCYACGLLALNPCIRAGRATAQLHRKQTVQILNLSQGLIQNVIRLVARKLAGGGIPLPKRNITLLHHHEIMTEKQIERVRTRIKKIRATLAAEKRKFGWYDDSRGIRFLPPELFIRIGDYSGALKYFRWFDKNFPGGAGFPDFLFEWALTLFKNGKHSEAEKKVFETFCANTYLFDQYFGKELVPIDKYEYSNLSGVEFAGQLQYSHTQDELADFTEWLAGFLKTDRFRSASEAYVAIRRQLKHEEDREKRGELIDASRQLEDNF